MPDGTQTPANETIHAKTRSVSCDGGNGAYGHPKIYLKITGTQINCPYCSRLFILAPGAADHSH